MKLQGRNEQDEKTGREGIPNLKLLPKTPPSLSTAGLTYHQLQDTSKGLRTPRSESLPYRGRAEVQAPFVKAGEAGITQNYIIHLL